ncbi:MAG: hypothetical protein ACQEP3_01110 [Patescibacteria group bacterium]
MPPRTKKLLIGLVISIIILILSIIFQPFAPDEDQNFEEEQPQQEEQMDYNNVPEV